MSASVGLSSTRRTSNGRGMLSGSIRAHPSIWQSEEKRRPLLRGRRHPHAPAVALYNLLADRQANARPRICAPRVQALKDPKDALEIARLDADAVVAHGKHPLLLPMLGADVDGWRPLAA